MFLKSLAFKTQKGVTPPHFKYTQDLNTQDITPPDKVIIPMQQHIGAVCVPTVKVGDTVLIGDIIGNSEKFISAPIHSSVSGKVSKIEKILMPNGTFIDCVIIESDGKMELSPSAIPPKVTSQEELIEATKNSGLVGLGGAGFPTHVKLNSSKEIDTLIINAAECEPFITSDYRGILEDIDYIIKGIKIVKNILKIKKAIISIEDNKPEAIEMLKKHIAKEKAEIEIKILKSIYPQGAEKILIFKTIGKKVPIGKLPSDVGCIVLNVSTISFLAKYIETGIPLVARRITVTGSGVKNPLNLMVPIGTPIKNIIDFCGGYTGNVKKILMGGPMMGTCIYDDSFPLLKQNNAILALDEKDALLPNPSACIHCGRCVEKCPMNLMPTVFEREVNLKNTDKLEKLGIMNCMECGCCSYICPASRPIVQTIRIGKSIIRNQKSR